MAGVLFIPKDGRVSSSLFIFSYPNSTDFSIDITDNITSFDNLIIKLNEKCKIENNIFGYIFLELKYMIILMDLN